ncbi:hypothetical protein L484_021754 [Morus notabilis]|uniref:Uncharacterized protein n=1 Tax=Morus notabilis TaxID=981085 RepID=W9S713_9ROSA|nr:hypothetical protein L484_021754 [Morus notabilis]
MESRYARGQPYRGVKTCKRSTAPGRRRRRWLDKHLRSRLQVFVENNWIWPNSAQSPSALQPAVRRAEPIGAEPYEFPRAATCHRLACRRSVGPRCPLVHARLARTVLFPGESLSRARQGIQRFLSAWVPHSSSSTISIRHVSGGAQLCSSFFLSGISERHVSQLMQLSAISSFSRITARHVSRPLGFFR